MLKGVKEGRESDMFVVLDPKLMLEFIEMDGTAMLDDVRYEIDICRGENMWAPSEMRVLTRIEDGAIF